MTKLKIAALVLLMFWLTFIYPPLSKHSKCPFIELLKTPVNEVNIDGFILKLNN